MRPSLPAAAAGGAESQRLFADHRGTHDWRLWGPYLSERQWGTVREDYSEAGEAWLAVSHEQARSRAYRWGEDGLLGICDRNSRLCFALALWNEKDPILKERLFGLGGFEGNHAEMVQESYHYLRATPTASYLKASYQYPQAAFPYAQLLAEARKRTKKDPELLLTELGVFEQQRYFDVRVEYAKYSPTHLLIAVTCQNCGPEPATLHVLPHLWLRNTWSWGRPGKSYPPKGTLSLVASGHISASVPELGEYDYLWLSEEPAPPALFTDNETNTHAAYGVEPQHPYAKDAFHRRIVGGDESVVRSEAFGTKCCYWQQLRLQPGQSKTLRLQLSERRPPASLKPENPNPENPNPENPNPENPAPHDRPPASTPPLALSGVAFDALLNERRSEAEEYHHAARPSQLSEAEREVALQADAGLVWTRQFYHYVVEHWRTGDPAQPPPPDHRKLRNTGWDHLWAEDVISMPDKWEYPWFAAWDLAFHAVAVARFDPAFAKNQILLLADERYMHPGGQLPAYEFCFSDANPPLLAWSAWRTYQLTGTHRGDRDREFLERAFHKSLVNFSWWVNRKDDGDNHIFQGGFLGLDNIGIFDRSRPPPGAGTLEQADATAWMAFYASTMLAMAVELSHEARAYDEIAAKFFDHFVAIANAMNRFRGTGLWDEQDGFYYDWAALGGSSQPLRIRSLVGLVPLLAAETLHNRQIERLPDLRDRIRWEREHRPEWTDPIACLDQETAGERRLLAVPPRERLLRVLHYLLDEREFLSPYGIRSLSRIHAERPFELHLDGRTETVRYTPGASDTYLFGGNSNWRGPVWLPLNYLLVEALKRHHHFYGDSLQVECPTGSGHFTTLLGAAEEIERRLARLFVPPGSGEASAALEERHGAWASGCNKVAAPHVSGSPALLFHEYFHGDTGEGLGASHQTGWTALIANILERVALTRHRR